MDFSKRPVAVFLPRTGFMHKRELFRRYILRNFGVFTEDDFFFVMVTETQWRRDSSPGQGFYHKSLNNISDDGWGILVSSTFI